MKKVLLFFIVINAICITSFSQNDITQERAIAAAKSQQEKLLKSLKSKDKIDWGDASTNNQFLIGDGNELKFGKNKNLSIGSKDKIEKVYKKITDKNNIKIEQFTYDKPDFNKATPIRGNVGGRGNQHNEIKAYDIVFDIKNCYTKLSA